ncbi:hypothetical protein AB0392_43010, partial [Nonomuraea angiospora]
MAGPRLISCVLALATLTLGACSSALPSPNGGEPKVSGVAGGNGGVPAGGGTVAGTPSPAALTAEAYKGELQSRHKSMADAI